MVTIPDEHGCSSAEWGFHYIAFYRDLVNLVISFYSDFDWATHSIAKTSRQNDPFHYLPYKYGRCTNVFCDFSTPPVQSIAPATKHGCQVIRSAAPVRQNHLNKPTDLMLQNATRLRKSAPWPPNISDEHVFCTAPATRNSSLQILFKCPTHAIGFGNATQPSRFAHFDKVHNPLRLPRKNDIWTPKSGPKPWCFVHFDFEMCFAPQRRALFRHLNFQKWSEAGVFCAFWLRNVLRATPACAFSTSQLPKAVRTWCVLYILTSKCASGHNGVQFFISHLDRWLRTRRFSEPTCRLSGATNHWKNTVWGREEKSRREQIREEKEPEKRRSRCAKR